MLLRRFAACRCCCWMRPSRTCWRTRIRLLASACFLAAVLNMCVVEWVGLDPSLVQSLMCLVCVWCVCVCVTVCAVWVCGGVLQCPHAMLFCTRQSECHCPRLFRNSMHGYHLI